MRRILYWVGAVAALFLLWQGLTMLFGFPEYILPAPLKLALALNQTYPEILLAVRPTLFEAVLGWLAGTAIGLLLAAGSVVSPLLDAVVMPVAVSIRSLPIVAITPVITLVVGYGYPTTITIVALVTFFPTLVAAARGLRSVDPRAADLLEVLAASQTQVFWYLRVPYMLPHWFAAIRVTAPAAVLGALISEWIASDRGLGFVILDSQSRWNVMLFWTAGLTATVLATLAFGLATLARRRLLYWHDSERTDSKG